MDTTEIGAGLSRAERETVIRRCDDEEHWDIFTSSPHMARRLAKIATTYGIMAEPTGAGVRYHFPLTALSLRNKRVLSEKQRARLQSRARENFSGKHGATGNS